MRKLTPEEKENLSICLNMRRNYIETHDVCMSAETAQKCGKKKEIRPLTRYQRDLINHIEDMEFAIFNDKFLIQESMESDGSTGNLEEYMKIKRKEHEERR